MFGYIIVNKPEMKFREFDVYHGYYCGLCKKLKQHYGKFGQITLSYDMTFVLMVLTSLYEPETTRSKERFSPSSISFLSKCFHSSRTR